MNRFSTYFSVFKPERTLANVMTTGAGFLLASAWHFDVLLLAATIIGTSLIVASACAVNNCTDRGIDSLMPRANKRPLVVGSLPLWPVVMAAIIFGAIGFWLLAVYVNWLTVLIGVIGYIDYVALYGWTKRHSVHSTLVGTISGSAPIVAGYTAVTGRFDLTALWLGVIMLFWQMAHFYAIGIFRREDYAAADIPVWPVKKGVSSTRRWIVLYVILYAVSVTGLALSDAGGLIFMLLVIVPSLYWLKLGLTKADKKSPEAWAKQMFGVSLVVLVFFSGALSLAAISP
jgi:protoheme IX farnesyltransferase